MARHNPFYRHRSGPHRHRGVSLIELMVGIAIGMLIVVAAIGTMLYTRASSTTIGDSARLHQDAATAFRIIGETVRQTGARRLNDAGGKTVEFNPNFTGLTTTVVITISGTDGATTPTIAADTLRIAYDSDSVVDVTDCLGSIAGGSVNNVTNTFEVSAGNLRCNGNAASTTAQPLIQSVEDFQVWYGIRDVTESLRYVSASDIPDWSLARVETVMVCLRLSGETRSNPTAASVGCSGEAVAADGRIRRVFTRVFNLRNAGF